MSLNEATDELRKAVFHLRDTIVEELGVPVWWGVPLWKVILTVYIIIAVLVGISELLR